MSENEPQAKPSEVAPETVAPSVPERLAASPAPAPETVIDRPAPAPVPLVEPPQPVASQPSTVRPLSEPVASTGPVEPSTAVAPQPVVAEPVAPAHVEPSPSVAEDRRVVYVDAPVPPRKKGNRGIGILLVIVATIVFAAVFALITIVVRVVFGAGVGSGFTFLTKPEFWVPALFFFVGSVILALIANRASWWAHVLGSLFVAIFVYAGTAATLLLVHGVVQATPQVATLLLRAELASPLVVAAGVLAREVSLWTGAGIAARGRRVKARNAEARAAFDQENDEQRAVQNGTGPIDRTAF